MKSITEIKEWLLKNCVDEDGDLNLRGLDFSDFEGNIMINDLRVGWDLHQDSQKVGGDLFQNYQEVEVNLIQNFQSVKGKLLQHNQKVGEDLYQDYQYVKGDLFQSNKIIIKELGNINKVLYDTCFGVWIRYEKVDNLLFLYDLNWEYLYENAVKEKVIEKEVVVERIKAIQEEILRRRGIK